MTRPQDMITVPCCKECNQRKSLLDQYLRDLVLMAPNAIQHPEAFDVIKHKFVPSVRRRQSKVGVEAAQATHQPLITSSGIYIGTYPLMEVDTQARDDALVFIILGLYYHLTKQMLPHGYEVDVREIPEPWATAAVNDFQRTVPGQYRVLGDGVCAFGYGLVDENPGLSAWIICFYKHVVFWGITEPEIQSDAIQIVTNRRRTRLMQGVSS